MVFYRVLLLVLLLLLSFEHVIYQSMIGFLLSDWPEEAQPGLSSDLSVDGWGMNERAV